MILVRYYSTGGYKLHNATNIRVVISRDVIFNEIKNLQQLVIGYQKVVTGYNNEKSVSAELENAESAPAETRIKENVRISTIKRGFPPRLQDWELL